MVSTAKQMVSRPMLAFAAVWLLAVVNAAPDIDVVVGNFALNLVSCCCELTCHIYRVYACSERILVGSENLVLWELLFIPD